MAVTPVYGWTKPTVGGDSGAWGGILNAALDAIDGVVRSVEILAGSMLPLSGGTLSGRLNAKTTSSARVDKGSISGAQTLDLSAAQFFTATIGGATTFSVSNVPAGTVSSGFALYLTNPGAFAITWPAGTKWPGGAPPAFTVAGKDRVVFLTDDAGTTWQAYVVGQDVK